MSRTRGFFGYEPELEAEIFDFRRSEYPDRDSDRLAADWRWMLVESAQRLGVSPLVWLYRRNGAVLAHQGAIPVRLHVKGKMLTTGWFVETLAAESIRGSPIGPMLIRKALEDMPLNLSLGQTKQMRQLQFAMGWHEVCSLSRYLLVTGYAMNLRHRLPAWAAPAAAAALGLWYKGRYNRGRHSRVAEQVAFRAVRITRFTEKHDALWGEMAQTCSCAVVRDSSYLNWKYIDRPDSEGRFIGIELSEDDTVVGVVVAMVSEPKGIYRYRRGSLVDFVVRLDRPDVIAALINHAVAALTERGAQTVGCQTASRGICAVLDTLGFAHRGARHRFLLASGGCEEALRKELLEPANWFLTLGDSDADNFPD